ncbi:putative GNAT acetyltransferase Mec 17 [Trypanosoma vivax]|uniref:Alpha-tubulin N-acetyltransferase n=1 Tax=Trypanosoma vivax (strain Y486) TaxID=1055687 RepID=G0TSF9_TRYVY|nr:hypothetical protein TRVL_07586 [Trypanosoma vivax]KAH8605458.1 putative GNAT acetyltransferase Mec 17 [Trypanosoma vivax]CCC46886.1 conserved hypothetical protein [Trypanosoma vivax Y486]
MSSEELPLLNLRNGVTRWNADLLEQERRLRNADGHADRLVQTINILGKRSKEAQSLNTILTSATRLRENREARIYLLCQEGRGVGILKVGVKRLFVTNPAYSGLVEINPVCVLDFFVDTSCQRRGYGKLLFEHMLEAERLSPGDVAIDRPSTKFLAFLRKHYGLHEYTPQSNNFVVFHNYFERMQPQRGKSFGGRDSWKGGSHLGPHGKTGMGLSSIPDANMQLGAGGPSRLQPDAGTKVVGAVQLSTTQASLASALPQHGGVGRQKTAYELQYEQYMQASRGSQALRTDLPPLSALDVSRMSHHNSHSQSMMQCNIINHARRR